MTFTFGRSVGSKARNCNSDLDRTYAKVCLISIRLHRIKISLSYHNIVEVMDCLLWVIMQKIDESRWFYPGFNYPQVLRHLGKVKEVVALVTKAIKVTTLVASLWSIYSKGFVLLHIWQPTADIRFYQIIPIKSPIPLLPLHFTVATRLIFHNLGVLMSWILMEGAPWFKL